jgi:hypothetical protein
MNVLAIHSDHWIRIRIQTLLEDAQTVVITKPTFENSLCLLKYPHWKPNIVLIGVSDKQAAELFLIKEKPHKSS